MKDKNVLITGATAGIGRESALAIAKMGAHVVIVGRNQAKTEGVVKELRDASGNPSVDYLLADLSSMDQVRKLAAEYRSRFGALHVLLNNAGGMNPRREVTVDGYERSFALNHLSYFLLTNLLLPALESGAPSRVVSVSSEAHRSGLIPTNIDFDDLMSERRYASFTAYGRSKLANILFTRELARRVADKNITANTLHPGFVASDFLEKGGFWSFIKPVAYLFAIDSVQGAKTSVYLATSPDVAGVTGKYFIKCKERHPSRAAQDDAIARRLWDVSLKLTGLGEG